MQVQNITDGAELIRHLGGHGNVVVLGSTFRAARHAQLNLRAAFPLAQIHAASWTRPENLVGLHEVLFLFLEEPPEEIMEWVRPAKGYSTLL